MKTILSILVVLSVVPVFAQTYTTEEFVVTGEPTTTTTTTTGSYAVPTAATTTTVVTTTAEAPIYVGMNKYHVVEVLGHPTDVQRFRRFAGRQQGIYDEVWTYQGPAGTTYVYIKERRVARIEYR